MRKRNRLRIAGITVAVLIIAAACGYHSPPAVEREEEGEWKDITSQKSSRSKRQRMKL